jgi:hypothetical protein
MPPCRTLQLRWVHCAAREPGGQKGQQEQGAREAERGNKKGNKCQLSMGAKQQGQQGGTTERRVGQGQAGEQEGAGQQQTGQGQRPPEPNDRLMETCHICNYLPQQQPALQVLTTSVQCTTTPAGNSSSSTTSNSVIVPVPHGGHACCSCSVAWVFSVPYPPPTCALHPHSCCVLYFAGCAVCCAGRHAGRRAELPPGGCARSGSSGGCASKCGGLYDAPTCTQEKCSLKQQAAAAQHQAAAADQQQPAPQQ